MEHNYIENNDIIDRYLLHQLSEEEDSLFEEHLLFCGECQEIIEERKKTINLIKENKIDAEEKKALQSSEKKSNNRLILNSTLLKIAAAIALLLSFTFIITLFFNKEINAKKLTICRLNPDSIKAKSPYYVDTLQIVTTNNDISKTEPFKELPVYEKFIKNTLRSENLEVLSPKINQKIINNNNIAFSWQNDDVDSLNLVIFDNKARLIFEKKISKMFSFKQMLNPGLYYWQLETSEEALFTGKFIIIE